MIRHIKRYLAIRSYMLRLSQELVRRFDKRSFYPIEQVTQAVERGRFSAAFIAYAHAAFCNQADFDAYYQPFELPVAMRVCAAPLRVAIFLAVQILMPKLFFSGFGVEVAGIQAG